MIASAAMRSAASRPPSAPRSVRQTTGAPVATSPAVQTTSAAPLLGPAATRTTAPSGRHASVAAGGPGPRRPKSAERVAMLTQLNRGDSLAVVPALMGCRYFPDTRAFHEFLGQPLTSPR